MNGRVERLANGLDPLEAGGAQFLPELGIDGIDRLPEGVGLRAPRIAGDRTMQVVEYVEQLAEQRSLGAVGQLEALPGGALPEVVELGGEPELPVLGIGELLLQPLDGRIGRLQGDAGA